MNGKKVFNPTKQVAKLSFLSNGTFANVQSDAHEFLIFLLPFLNEETISEITIFTKIELTCQTCLFTSEQNDKSLTYLV